MASGFTTYGPSCKMILTLILYEVHQNYISASQIKPSLVSTFASMLSCLMAHMCACITVAVTIHSTQGADRVTSTCQCGLT